MVGRQGTTPVGRDVVCPSPTTRPTIWRTVRLLSSPIVGREDWSVNHTHCLIQNPLERKLEARHAGRRSEMGLTMEMRKGFAREKAALSARVEEGLIGSTWSWWAAPAIMPHGRCAAGVSRCGSRLVDRSRCPLTAAHGADLRPADGRRADQVVAHFGYLCGKRLAATLRLWLPHYEGWTRAASARSRSPRRCAPSAAHQPCDHRPVAARRETQTLSAGSATRRNPPER